MKSGIAHTRVCVLGVCVGCVRACVYACVLGGGITQLGLFVVVVKSICPQLQSAYQTFGVYK